MENWIAYTIIAIFVGFLIAKKLKKKEKNKTPSNSNLTPAPSVDYSCAMGTYDFKVRSDPTNVHFTYTLHDNGVVRYNLEGGPVGNYTIRGKIISMDNVFPNEAGRLLVLNVAEQTPNCKYQVLRGKVNGADVVSRRIG